MVDKANTTPILHGQDRETLTFKALLYLNVAVVDLACCISHCSAWLPHYNEYFCCNQIIRYNRVLAITKTPLFGTVTLRYSGVPLYKD